MNTSTTATPSVTTVTVIDPDERAALNAAGGWIVLTDGDRVVAASTEEHDGDC